MSRPAQSAPRLPARLVSRWRTVVLCVLVGVAMTIASAWLARVFEHRKPGLARGLSHHTRRVPAQPSGEDPPVLPSYLRIDPHLAWPCEVPSDWPLQPFEVRVFEGPIGAHQEFAWASSNAGWSRAVTVVRCGVPFRCLRYETLSSLLYDSSTGFTQTTTTMRGGMRIGSIDFPLRPIFPGILINVVFWASFPYALTRVAPILRARRRVRRGCCPSCGYHIAGLTRCPECGEDAPRAS